MARKTDPQAVKEALTSRDIADLKSSITQLSTEVKDGFAGIHMRRDTTNGRISTNEKALSALDFKFKYNRIIWYLFTASMVLITALVMFIVTRHYSIA